MDSITHIALGACIGEAFFGKVIGRKAMLWGALAQSVPDVDFVSAFWLDPTSGLLAHRGFTHSFLFGLIMAVFLSLVAEKWHRPHNISFRRWMWFFNTEILVHLMLDGLNNYGVGWFEPFSQARFSLNAIFVADPFFSIWPGIACLFLLLLRRGHPNRRFWKLFGLVPACLYLGYCIYNKTKIENDVVEASRMNNFTFKKHLTTPTPLNNWLWYVILENDSGYLIGYRSVFDRTPNMNLNFYPRNEHLLEKVKEQKDVVDLLRFSQGFYTVEQWGDTLVFNDLRFGQIIGWHDPKERFAFHYFITFPDQNTMVVQRGRFAKWNRETVNSLIRRIQGL
jgi:inner membrane protein